MFKLEGGGLKEGRKNFSALLESRQPTGENTNETIRLQGLTVACNQSRTVKG